MQKTKKRTIILAVIAVLVLVFMLAGCGKSEFGVTGNTNKQMTITAKNAGKDAFFSVGSLEVADGEQIVMTSNLENGSVKVEIFKVPDNQSIDKLPEMGGDPVMTANFDGADKESKMEKISGGVAAGIYAVKATCLEKADGTILVEVQPAK